MPGRREAGRVYESNMILHNRYAGVGFRNRSCALFDGNIFSLKKGCSMLMQDDADTVKNNIIEGNKLTGFSETTAPWWCATSTAT